MEIGTYQDVVNKAYYGPPIGDCRSQLYQITNGLAHIHDIGCVHRDLRPHSIRIILPAAIDHQEPILKLSGFGFSRVRDGQDHFPLTKLADCDPWFTAPEVCDSEEFTSTMDIFSLGCIWAIALSGDFSHPFGCRNSAINRIQKRRSINLTLKDFKNVTREEAELVFALVRSMLSFTPGVRPTSLDILRHPYFAHLSVKAKDPVTPSSKQKENGNLTILLIHLYYFDNIFKLKILFLHRYQPKGR